MYEIYKNSGSQYSLDFHLLSRTIENHDPYWNIYKYHVSKWDTIQKNPTESHIFSFDM